MYPLLEFPTSINLRRKHAYVTAMHWNAAHPGLDPAPLKWSEGKDNFWTIKEEKDGKETVQTGRDS